MFLREREREREQHLLNLDMLQKLNLPVEVGGDLSRLIEIKVDNVLSTEGEVVGGEVTDSNRTSFSLFSGKNKLAY
jgi:hypothetical protein